MKNRTTAALIAFFLGAFDGQYFYLGKTGKGIACFVLFWTFIPTIIALYHTIKFLTMSDEAFNAEYNNGIAPLMGYAYASGASVGDELTKLHELKEKGVLTEEEFSSRKAKLLA